MTTSDDPTLIRLRCDRGPLRFRRLEIRRLEKRQAWGVFVQGTDHAQVVPLELTEDRTIALLHRADLLSDAEEHRREGWYHYYGPPVSGRTIAAWVEEP